MEKGAYVKDIIEGNTAEGIFVATDASLLQSRAGDPYWALKLQDASGSIDCKIWKPLSQKFTEIPQGSIVRASGRAGSFRDQMQLEISGMTILDEESAAGIPPAWIMPSSPHDLDEMLEELCALCKEEFVHRPWARLAGKVLNDAEYRAFFRVWPAARVMHQAYAGGLLEHTLQVFRICRQIADLYPELDRQTLLAGALFHDFGKIREFSGGLSNDYTTDGLLVGHIVLGVQMLAPFLAKSDLEEHLQQHLTHLILSLLRSFAQAAGVFRALNMARPSLLSLAATQPDSLSANLENMLLQRPILLSRSSAMCRAKASAVWGSVTALNSSWP